MSPQTTLPQPGLQRRWTAIDGEDVSDGGEADAGLADGGEQYVGYGSPRSQTRDDQRDGFAKWSAIAPWQCPRSQTCDDLRSGFALEEPLIAAKRCLPTLVDEYGWDVRRWRRILRNSFMGACCP